MGFEAQEFIASGAVGIRVGAMLLPSTFTTETSLVRPIQRPFGTYAVTLFPTTSADNELDPRQEPCGTVPPLGGGVPPLGGGVPLRAIPFADSPASAHSTSVSGAPRLSVCMRIFDNLAFATCRCLARLIICSRER